MEGERAWSSSGETDRLRRWVIGLLVLGCVAVVFGPVRGFGFISLDDPVTVTANPLVNTPPDAAKVAAAFVYSGPLNLWHPLTWWSHQWDTAVFGFPAAGFRHLTNLALHLLTLGLLYALLLRVGADPVAAGAAALVYGLHPQRVEAVAWVTSRKELLAAAWVLAAVWAWSEFRRTGRPAWWGVSVIAGVAAMASHPVAVMLPAVLLLWDAQCMPVAPRRRPWLPGPEHAPLLLAALAVAGLTLWLHARGGHAAAEGLRGPMERGTKALLGFGHYVRTLAWPWPSRLFEIPPADMGGRRWIALIGLAGAAGSVWLWRWAARTRRPAVCFGLGWAALFFLPVSGLAAAASPYLGADRHTHLPHAGLALALAAMLPSRGWAARSAVGGLLVLALIFGGLTRVRLRDWQDDFSLFGAEMRRNPRSKIAPLHLGAAWMAAGRPDEALRMFEQALAIDPDFELARRNAARAREVLRQTDGLRLGPPTEPAMR